jgi:hypothetical protein
MPVALLNPVGMSAPVGDEIKSFRPGMLQVLQMIGLRIENMELLSKRHQVDVGYPLAIRAKLLKQAVALGHEIIQRATNMHC